MEKELSKDFNVRDAGIKLAEMEKPDNIPVLISGDERNVVSVHRDIRKLRNRL